MPNKETQGLWKGSISISHLYPHSFTNSLTQLANVTHLISHHRAQITLIQYLSLPSSSGFQLSSSNFCNPPPSPTLSSPSQPPHPQALYLYYFIKSPLRPYKSGFYFHMMPSSAALVLPIPTYPTVVVTSCRASVSSGVSGRVLSRYLRPERPVTRADSTLSTLNRT